ncbi:helix-turn-helix domain-containing protein [Variovorax sp. HJSM1_2]|uniref:helix-turn-helix domain-containing protein n=1 Tax=Variovorax sp. HJSM1_2 TaxID=3366263 RepID=UPI003BE7E1CD
MDVRPIRTERDYRAMLATVSRLIDMDPDPNSPEGERLEVLGLLVESYEGKRYAIAAPSPIQAIKFRMEQGGMTVADMRPYIGPPNRVYEVLNGTRPLSLAMIRRLRTLGISAEVLIGNLGATHG